LYSTSSHICKTFRHLNTSQTTTVRFCAADSQVHVFTECFLLIKNCHTKQSIIVSSAHLRFQVLQHTRLFLLYMTLQRVSRLSLDNNKSHKFTVSKMTCAQFNVFALNPQYFLLSFCCVQNLTKYSEVNRVIFCRDSHRSASLNWQVTEKELWKNIRAESPCLYWQDPYICKSGSSTSGPQQVTLTSLLEESLP